jgi:hypothetical protein
MIVMEPFRKHKSIVARRLSPLALNRKTKAPCLSRIFCSRPPRSRREISNRRHESAACACSAEKPVCTNFTAKLSNNRPDYQVAISTTFTQHENSDWSSSTSSKNDGGHPCVRSKTVAGSHRQKWLKCSFDEVVPHDSSFSR